MKTIILQQKDSSVLEVATICLQDNYQVVSLTEFCSDCEDLIKHKKPQMIILDFILDGGLALTSLKKIKDLYPLIPVAAMSCNNDIEETAKAHGFDCFIKKPFDIDNFIEVIRNTISGQQIDEAYYE